MSDQQHIEGVEYLIDKPSELKVYQFLEHLPMFPLIPHFDFTTIGLRTETSKYGEKGVKLSTPYTAVVENGDRETIIEKSFFYVENGVWIKIAWFKINGDPGIVKTFFKPLNVVEIAKINKSNRDRSITYLQASAVGTPIESHVNELLRHYKELVDLFIYNNVPDFKNKIQSETEQPYKGYLEIPIAPNKTVKDSILAQL